MNFCLTLKVVRDVACFPPQAMGAWRNPCPGPGRRMKLCCRFCDEKRALGCNSQAGTVIGEALPSICTAPPCTLQGCCSLQCELEGLTPHPELLQSSVSDNVALLTSLTIDLRSGHLPLSQTQGLLVPATGYKLILAVGHKTAPSPETRRRLVSA